MSTTKTKTDTVSEQDNLRQVGRDLLGSLAGPIHNSLRRQAGFSRLREITLRTERAALAARLGEEAPEVQAVERRLNLAARQARTAARNLHVSELGQQIQPDSSVVIGQVTAPEGRSGAGLKVVVTDEKSSRKKPAQSRQLGEATTDAGGFYLVQSPEQDFQRFFAKSSQLVVIVAGEPGLHHVESRPLGEERQRLRIVDVSLPSEAFSSPPSSKDAEPIAGPPDAPAKGVEPARPTLSDLRGIGPRRLDRLAANGIRDLSALVEQQPRRLQRLLRISRGTAVELIEQARTLLLD